jgi:hypothetical protein
MFKTLLALGMVAALGWVRVARASEQNDARNSRLVRGSSAEMLSDEPSADSSERARASDTVEERRHFDRRLIHLGGVFGTAAGTGSYFALVGLYAEANVWDRLALGVGTGVSFWGPEASGSLRFRPIVWGGEGQHVLNAFMLRAEYTVMQQGADIFSFCDESCGTRFVARTAQLGTLSAGFEHQLWSGWTIRYDFGFARVFSATPWKCRRDGLPAPCSGEPPSDDLSVTSFAVSHAL